MTCKVLMSTLLAGFLSAVAMAPTAKANPSSYTECVPFNPYHGVTHQECTTYFYGSDGTLLFTNVYYIDENGMWYLP